MPLRVNLDREAVHVGRVAKDDQAHAKSGATTPDVPASRILVVPLRLVPNEVREVDKRSMVERLVNGGGIAAGGGLHLEAVHVEGPG